MRNVSLTLVLVLFVLAVSGLDVYAQFSSGQGGPDMKNPPKPLVEACEGKSEGDACSFNGPRGNVSGQCTRVESNLVCIPEFMKDKISQNGSKSVTPKRNSVSSETLSQDSGDGVLVSK